jgi:hypothetical protein
VRVIVHRSESVRKRVSQLAPFVYGARRFWNQPLASLISIRGLQGGYTWSHVRANAARKTELLEEALHAIFVLRYVRVDFTVDAFEVEVGDETWGTVPRAGDNEGIHAVLLDHAVEVNTAASRLALIQLYELGLYTRE